MINLMVVNKREKPNRKYKEGKLEKLLEAQVENVIAVGWRPEEVVIVANFEHEHMGIKTVFAELNGHCLSGSKMFAVKWLLDNGKCGENEIIYAHDLDAWQNYWFDPPEMRDVGITTYSTSKYNGGSVFWRPAAADIVDRVVEEIGKGEEQEEPALNRLLKSKDYRDRVTLLDNTYNVGCSGFVPRATRAKKPIRVSHFNPFNRIAWETHRMDRNYEGVVSISARLEELLRRHFNLATAIADVKGIERGKEEWVKNEKKK